MVHFSTQYTQSPRVHGGRGWWERRHGSRAGAASVMTVSPSDQTCPSSFWSRVLVMIPPDPHKRGLTNISSRKKGRRNDQTQGRKEGPKWDPWDSNHSCWERDLPMVTHLPTLLIRRLGKDACPCFSEEPPFPQPLADPSSELMAFFCVSVFHVSASNYTWLCHFSLKLPSASI